MVNIVPLESSGNKVYVGDTIQYGEIQKRLIPQYNIKYIISLDNESSNSVRRELSDYNLQTPVSYVNHIDLSSPHTGGFVLDRFFRTTRGNNDYYPMLIHCNNDKIKVGFAVALWVRENLGYKPEDAVKMAERYGYDSKKIPEASKNTMDKIIGLTEEKKEEEESEEVEEVLEDLGLADDAVGSMRDDLFNANPPAANPQLSWAPAEDASRSYMFTSAARKSRMKLLKKLVDKNNLFLDGPPTGLAGAEAPASGTGLPKKEEDKLNLDAPQVGSRSSYNGIPDTYLNAPSGSPGAPNAAMFVDPGGLVQL